MIYEYKLLYRTYFIYTCKRCIIYYNNGNSYYKKYLFPYCLMYNLIVKNLINIKCKTSIVRFISIKLWAGTCFASITSHQFALIVLGEID